MKAFAKIKESFYGRLNCVFWRRYVTFRIAQLLEFFYVPKKKNTKYKKLNAALRKPCILNSEIKS